MRIQYKIFDQCVSLLHQAAEFIGTDYRTLCVELFGVLLVLMAFMVFLIWYYRDSSRHYRLCWKLLLNMRERNSNPESLIGRDK